MSFRRYRDHLRRTLLTLGMILLIGVMLSLAAEQGLRGAGSALEADQARATSLKAVFSLIFASLKATLSMALASVELLLPLVGMLVAVPWLTARLVHRLYAMRDLKEAHDTVNRKVFGQLGFGPYLLIKEGKIAAGGESPIQRMGGPASLVVYNDTAVVTQRYGRPKRVLDAGFHRLEQFEKVWETVDLRPQRWVHEVFALTKEGIPISCEADISFRIDDGIQDVDERERNETPPSETPFPHTDEAVFQAATSKWIREPDRADRQMAWTGRVVVGFAEGLLRDILAEYRLDWLIAPPQPDHEHPREEIRARLEKALGEKVAAVGAKIARVELGTIQVKAKDEETSDRLSDMVSKQWIEAWYADWKSRALTRKAEGEAELLRIDAARMQAQAEMVITLTETLQSTILSKEGIEPYTLALRFVEALRWMSYDPYTREFMPPEAVRTLGRLGRLLGPGSSGRSDEEADKS